MTVVLHTGDALAVLPTLPSESVQCCVTSPPYFGLRDYGVAGQIGLEASPAEYVARLVDVFEEVRRVLRPDGTLWLNLGDSYCTAGTRSGDRDGQVSPLRNEHRRFYKRADPVIRDKNLYGMPWRVAFALQDAGWWLRCDIIWSKGSCMPEAVTDRPTRSHEYLFLLAKSARYYYDNDAVREPFADDRLGNCGTYKSEYHLMSGRNDEGRKNREWLKGAEVGGRNKRSVWHVNSQPFAESHFATMPPALVEPCIRAGSRPGDTILDPFSGAGTTGLVASQLGRSYVGIELNADYNAMAERRIRNAAPLFVAPETIAAPEPEDAQASLFTEAT